MKLLHFVLGVTLPCVSFAQSFDSQVIETAEKIRAESLADNTAWSFVEDLTTEVGPRMPGTKADNFAVEWTKSRFESMGFDRVYLEPVEYDLWRRGPESLELKGEIPQSLKVTALGGSVGTNGDIDAEVVYFDSLAALKAMDASQLKNKIAFIDQRMERTINGSGYGAVVGMRSEGAQIAGPKGALAVLIRSVGTDSDRLPHTGMMRYGKVANKIPTAAVSNPDADQLARRLKRGSVRVNLNLDCGFVGRHKSHNVIAEVIGQESPEKIIVIGGHLDSWDLGTGALDDGAGVGITAAAAQLLLAPQYRPKHTIRVVAFANEEQGLVGGYHYRDQHKNELKNHIVGSESDFGAGLVWRFDTNVADSKLPYYEEIYSVLAPLGIERGVKNGGGGPDISPIQAEGVPTVRLYQDGSDYFDYHHTANDTLDKIDPAALNQNVSAWATMLYMIGQI